MSEPSWLAWVLLAPGLAVEVLCAVGLVVLRDVLDRLHLLGPAGGAGALLIAGAVALDSTPLDGGALKALLVALVLLVTGPVLAHAIGRAAMPGRDRQPAPAGAEGGER